jgi:hypothetical protein
MLPPQGRRSEQWRSTLVNGATVRWTASCSEDGELAAVRQAVIEERGEGDPVARGLGRAHQMYQREKLLIQVVGRREFQPHPLAFIRPRGLLQHLVGLRVTGGRQASRQPRPACCSAFGGAFDTPTNRQRLPYGQAACRSSDKDAPLGHRAE